MPWQQGQADYVSGRGNRLAPETTLSDIVGMQQENFGFRDFYKGRPELTGGAIGMEISRPAIREGRGRLVNQGPKGYGQQKAYNTRARWHTGLPPDIARKGGWQPAQREVEEGETAPESPLVAGAATPVDETLVGAPVVSFDTERRGAKPPGTEFEQQRLPF